jgi:hypothetical protein
MLFLFGILTLNSVLVGCEHAVALALVSENVSHEFAPAVADANVQAKSQSSAAKLQQVRRAAMADASLSF